jgi:thymidylate synthase
MVNAWNVGELNQMVLPPCHYSFQVYTRELSESERVKFYYKKHNKGRVGSKTTKFILDNDNIPTRAISLMWNQRSADTFLGLPFNIASYGLLLMMIADEVNMVPDELIGNLGDTHLYSNHIEQAKEQIGKEPMELPTVTIKDDYKFSSVSPHMMDTINHEHIILENYQSHPSIKAPLSN